MVRGVRQQHRVLRRLPEPHAYSKEKVAPERRAVSVGDVLDEAEEDDEETLEDDSREEGYEAAKPALRARRGVALCERGFLGGVFAGEPVVSGAWVYPLAWRRAAAPTRRRALPSLGTPRRLRPSERPNPCA